MKSQAEKLARLIRFLEKNETFTNAEMAKYTGMRLDSVNRLTRKLREPGPNKMLRVCAWDADLLGRKTVRVFARGTRADASRPPRLTQAEKDFRSEQRKAARELGRAVLGSAGSTRKKEPATSDQ